MYGWRAQVGFIVPSNNTVIEPELYHVVPEGVSYHFTKLVFGRPSTDGRNQDVDGGGVAIFQRAGMDAIMYACMATSLVDATQWERETTQQTGIPAATAANSLKEALQLFNVRSVALVCHYVKDRLPLVKKSFEADGFNVVAMETFDESDSKRVNRISTEAVYRLARKVDRPEADAVCLLATDLRTFPILQRAEDDVGKPVISTNQAILWKALQLAGIKERINGYGSLLAGDVPQQAATGHRR